MKISLIDMTNSTHLNVHRSNISLKEIVDLILNIKDFDQRIQQGDPELVNVIARSNGKVNLFSFASKYCTYHNVDIYENDDYSIFDSVVKNALPHYVSGLKSATIDGWRKAFNYNAYNSCITLLLDENEIHIDLRRRKLDHFLWYTYR